MMPTNQTTRDTVLHKSQSIQNIVVFGITAIGLWLFIPVLPRLAAQAVHAPVAVYPSKRMADGKQWTTHNLNIVTKLSYCYKDGQQNCDKYGRLYTWELAQGACQFLGSTWRLPREDEWREMAKLYGGASADSEDKGRAAYQSLLAEGSSGFDAVLGGGRSHEGQYARLDAHGFYWTATADGPATAWYYNFGKGGQALHRQSGGEKQRAFAVRCVRE